MEFRQLRYFVALAEHLHFGRAANQLHVVQSAVSQQIKLLEEELGVQLLHRSRHRVELSEAGRIFLPEARRALVQADAAARAARAAATGNVGRLEFGFVDNAIWSILPRILKAFRDRYPGIELQLHQADRPTLLRYLEEGRLDVSIIPAPLPRGPLSSEPMLEADFVVALPSEHKLTRKDVLVLEDLASEPFVLFPNGMQTRINEIVLSACASAGFTPTIIQEARQMHTMLSLVSTGQGVTLVPEWAQSIQVAGLVYRPLSTKIPKYALHTTWRTEATNPTVATFRKLASELAGTF
jgi:DNA-binding transcriptional LysR family regulator